MSGQDQAKEVWPNANNMEGSRLYLTDLLNLTDPTDQPDRLNQIYLLKSVLLRKTAILLDFVIFRGINTFIRNQIILAIFPNQT